MFVLAIQRLPNEITVAQTNASGKEIFPKFPRFILSFFDLRSFSLTGWDVENHDNLR